mmetsp:Transcript_110519/g.155124  ORF Transcript_110519/g.155124 Transcript_110519/m.155124 type:complete len:124 (+) Transcript_110519:66-437(+)
MAGPAVDIMEALRPNSREELRDSIANAGKRKRLPNIVRQLEEFVQQQQICQERCVLRLRERASHEAGLVPSGNLPGSSRPSTSSGDLQDDVSRAVHQRFAALDGQCSALCGRRLAHLVVGSAA